MGKKSFYKKRVKSFMKSNGVVLAAIAGAAAGVLITRVLGSERAMEMMHNVGGSVKNLSQKLMNGKAEALRMAKAS